MPFKRPEVRLFISESDPSEIALSIELKKCFVILGTKRCGNPFEHNDPSNPFIVNGINSRFICIEKDHFDYFMMRYQMRPTTLTSKLYCTFIDSFNSIIDGMPFWFRFKKIKVRCLSHDSTTIYYHKKYRYVKNGLLYDATPIKGKIEKFGTRKSVEIVSWIRYLDRRMLDLAFNTLCQFEQPKTISVSSRRLIPASELKGFQFFRDNEGYVAILYKNLYLFEQMKPRRVLTENMIGNDQMCKIDQIDWSLTVCDPSEFSRCDSVELNLLQQFKGAYIERVDIRCFKRLKILKLYGRIYFKIGNNLYVYDRFLLTYDSYMDLTFKDMDKNVKEMTYKMNQISIDSFIETCGFWAIMVHRDVCLSEISPLPKSYISTDLIETTISESIVNSMKNMILS